MPYKNFKLYLGYKDVPNSSYSQSGITGEWAVATFNNRSTASYNITLPPGSNYTLVSSNCSSSYTGTFTASLFANHILFSTVTKGWFTVQQLEAINASVMSYTISYTAKVGEAYNRIFLGYKSVVYFISFIKSIKLFNCYLIIKKKKLNMQKESNNIIL